MLIKEELSSYKEVEQLVRSQQQLIECFNRALQLERMDIRKLTYLIQLTILFAYFSLT